MPSSRPQLSLELAGVLAGRYRWLEGRLFETLGGWVQGVPELDVKLRIAVHASHHAWHAELWEERLPRVGSTDSGLTGPPNVEMASFVEALAQPREPHQTVEKLVGVYRVVLPRLVTAYTLHLGAASALSDGPTMRCLRLILRDEVDHWTQGELLVQSLLADEPAARRAADHQARLEGLLIRAGGIGLPTGPDARPGAGFPADPNVLTPPDTAAGQRGPPPGA